MKATKAPSQRQLRVGELIRHALAEILSRGEISDPDLDGVTVTVIQVSVSPDLKNAIAFVVPLGGGNAEKMIAALERCRKFIRGQVGKRVALKHMPNLTFELDTSFDYSETVDRLLSTPHVAQDLNSEIE
jgi:ribosome-binding factor A